MKKTIEVVGAIIENKENEILCALRSKQMTLSNMWEFPGGKIEENETIQDTIQREIKEELDCIIKAENTIFYITRYEYDKFIVNLTTIRCKIVEGNPKAQEHSKLIWLNKENLLSLSWAPADIPAVNKLIKS